MSLRARLSGLGRSDILRLMTGTVGGRLIALAAMPLVTRLYSPQDFALLAVYLATVSLIGAIACLRFDVAIPVAQDDGDAIHLLVLALVIAGTMATASLIAVLVAPLRIAALLGQPSLAPWLWLVPFGILLSGGYAALQFWATRARRFGSIARTRISQAAVGVSTMLALGWAGIAPFGLLLGNLLNSSAGSLRLGTEAIRRDRAALRLVTWPGLRAAFRAYHRFPLYSAPEALANLAGIQIPIMIVAAYAGTEAGFLLLAQQVMAAPMSLLGSSISQVYVSRAPEALRDGRLAPFTLSILRRLIQIGIGPLILAGILAPILFPLVFGTGWTRAGEIVSWLVPWMALQFLASPISMALHVTGRQSWAALLQVGGLILRIGFTLTVPLFVANGYVIGLAVSAAIFYAIYTWVVLRASGILARRGWWRELIGPALYILPWIAVGGILALVF
ncbi:MAG: oligosaccharide flippase family protein [Rubellimicrobium sp.]|nr:oligosaccharide flippase family protein [Rubellimicrobium sp.]